MIPINLLNDHILNLSRRKISLFFLEDLGKRDLDSWARFLHRNQRQLIYWPTVFSHDQELLDFNRYSDDHIQNSQIFQKIKHISFLKNLNLRWRVWPNIYDKAIITHSEINSEEVEKYKNNHFEPVYFWSHAIIARDWFRYAEHDPAFTEVNLDRRPWNDFLVYSRGWQGTREYRLLMADLMIRHDLIKNSNYSILHVEDYQDLESYSAEDPRYQEINLARIKNLVRPCKASARSSARYDTDDFLNSAISVVLETQFSDQRIHLTEKILRPIALGHPFILAAGPGSLKYLQSYGFKTYAPDIDESYDQETDPIKRLEMICQEMVRIRSLPEEDKKILYKNLRAQAQENRKWFFSKEFESMVINELNSNFLAALKKVKTTSKGRLLLENSRQRRNAKKLNLNKKLSYEDPSNKTEFNKIRRNLVSTLWAIRRRRLRKSI